MGRGKIHAGGGGKVSLAMGEGLWYTDKRRNILNGDEPRRKEMCIRDSNMTYMDTKTFDLWADSNIDGFHEGQVEIDEVIAPIIVS